jgi:hypothetical protein
MDCHFPFGSPKRRTVHEGEAISSSDEGWNIALGPFGIDHSLFIKQIIDCFSIE